MWRASWTWRGSCWSSNKVPADFDHGEVKERVERTYDAKVAAVLPHSDEMMVLGSAGIFGLHQPDHPLTNALCQVAADRLDDGSGPPGGVG
jgi:hypothetical protein